MAKAKDQYAHFEEFANEVEGYDDINMDTMAIPFIRIIQALSPQLKKSKAEYIADAEEGDICNSITGKLYEKPLRIVVGKFERLYIEWKPNRGGFVQAHAPEMVEGNPQRYRLMDVQGNLKLIDMETKNELVDTYMYYVLLPDYVEDGICLLACTSTQLTQAKKLNRQLKTTYIPGTTQKALPHFMIFTLDTIEVSNDKGEWFGIDFKFSEFVTPAQLENVREQRLELPNKTVDLAQIEENAGQDQPIEQDDVKY